MRRIEPSQPAEPVPNRLNTTALPGSRRTEPRVVSKNLVNNTELTLMMPVKPGFVPTRDTITYATRARVLMEAFHGFRQISREASEHHPFVDVVERINTIQSYRLNLLENDTKLLLAVSFDQPWEPYIRRIWRDTGPFLDSILCNCVDYERYASRNGFEAFTQWVRKTQVDTDFFYIADNLSVDDREYLEQTEREQREGPGSAAARDLAIARSHLPDIEEEAAEEQRRDPDETILTGLRALGVLYRLNDLYPKTPDSHDHEYYHQAVRRLLYNFPVTAVPDPLRKRFDVELKWYEQTIRPHKKPRPRPKPGKHQIQAGIIGPYRRATHGVMLLMRVKRPREAGKFIRRLPISDHSQTRTRGLKYNIGFTHQGLVQMQVDPADLESLPQEFREGMAARAGMLGDVRCNHPSNWNLPERSATCEAAANTPRVQMDSVDFVVQIRCTAPNAHYIGEWGPEHPLFATVADLDDLPGRAGVQLLAVQAMAHQRDTSGRYQGKIREHFGFVDGLSQPKLSNTPRLDDDEWNNDAAYGDVLLGHSNSYYDPAYPRERRGGFTDNGTFLVVRKLRQDVAALEARLPSEPAERKHVLAKMMGRELNGKPLVGKAPNDFAYGADKEGDGCPLHAHIRRTNPREVTKVAADDRDEMIRTPRLVRRGMSYGPRVDRRDPASLKADRGLMFMAYNASIAEQFEIVQRWVSGGNATGGYSGQSDPFLGVPEHGKARTFRYVDNGRVMRQPLDDPNEPRPLVKLEWGMYLFVPAMKTLRAISKPMGRPGLVERGERIIQRLQRIEAEQALGFPTEAHEVSIFDRWKAVLEDLHPSREEDLDAVWAAIRANHGGVLRTPYGVLVGSEKLVREVFADDGRRYSVRKYWWRLKRAFGEIYLSMDPRPAKFPGDDPSQPRRQRPYHRQVSREDYANRSAAVNKHLNSFSELWAFKQSHAYATGYLAKVREQLGVQGNLRVRDLVDFVLGQLSKDWFGIPDGSGIRAGGEPTVRAPDTLHCPYHFVASSRYAFSPNPGPAARAEGRDHGARLQASTEAWVRKINASPRLKNETPIGGKMFELMGNKPPQLASELIGVMHGFLPSTLGNLLKGIAVWTDDGNLWRIQEDYLASDASTRFGRANEAIRDPLMRVMQYRPVPDQLHRIAVARGMRLGKEKIEPGDTIVVGIGSASAQALDKGRADVTWVFGGDYGECDYKKKGNVEKPSKNYGTHGCPGRKIAMGTLLGITAALMEAGQIKAEPAPLILTIDE